MPRLTIDQFRARLSGRAQAPLLEAYREMSRRAELRAAIPGQFGDWTTWPPSSAA